MEKSEIRGNVPPVRSSYKIASIPADGIGPEVIAAGIQVLSALAAGLDKFDIEFDHFDWSSGYYRENGKYLPDDALKVLKGYNAILFGAVGDPGLSTPSLPSECIVDVNNNWRFISRNKVFNRKNITNMCKQIFQTIFPCGDLGSPSANPFNSMPMSALLGFYGVYPPLFAAVLVKI